MLSESDLFSNGDPLDRTLKECFHLPGFRPHQREAIESVLVGRDTLVIMPTGGGKSLCYQLPATLLPGITLVISPLIALMKDQVDRLRKLGISAVALNSTLSYAENRALVRSAQDGRIKVLFAAPERLESHPFKEELAYLPISLLAIDEAHCISQWGHDFRTSYRRIPEVYSHFANGKRPPIVALTATATPDVREDIVQLLGLQNHAEVITGFERPNLGYGVIRESDKDARVKDIIRSLPDSSVIVYAATRKSVDRIASWLKKDGCLAEAYHAGAPLPLRRQVQERFQSGRTKVMIATSAFGMGVDKPDVRAVIHYDIPGSLEAYYQEAGRAGRDGERANAVLIYNEGDRTLQESLIRSNSPTEEEVKSVYTALHEIAGTAVGSVFQGVLTVPSDQVLTRIVRPRAGLEQIIEALVSAGHVKRHRGLSNDGRSRIRFIATRARLDEVSYKSASRSVKQTISALLRTVDSEAFERDVFVDEEALIERHNLDAEEFKIAIRTIEGLGLVRFSPALRARAGTEVFQLSLVAERMPIKYLDVGGAALQARYEANMARLDAMVSYATAWECRRNMILRYFGEHPLTARCGICDVCSAREVSA